MQSSGDTATDNRPDGSSDIVFACTHCATSFVVDAAAAGLTLPCQRCGQQTVVPNPAAQAAAADAVKIAELQHQLKENESQRTEITSYINQHSIQLHRWQLRLKDLNERQKKLQNELGSLTATKRA
ncbi:MAG: hypothetical protein ABR589_00645 [Chthoniobacterales bacterium]